MRDVRLNQLCEASIFRPDNGKYVLVARLQMADWPRIAAAAK
jgi:hypothetical protein